MQSVRIMECVICKVGQGVRRAVLLALVLAPPGFEEPRHASIHPGLPLLPPHPALARHLDVRRAPTHVRKGSGGSVRVFLRETSVIERFHPRRDPEMVLRIARLRVLGFPPVVYQGFCWDNGTKPHSSLVSPGMCLFTGRGRTPQVHPVRVRGLCRTHAQRHSVAALCSRLGPPRGPSPVLAHHDLFDPESGL